MNRIYRIIWSKAQHAWVVASEFAKTTNSKSGRATRPAHTKRRVAVRARQSLVSAAIIAALVALSPSVQADDKYWDANGTGVGSGGSGSWDLATLRWSINADGVSGPYDPWSNAALDIAIFGGTAGTATLVAPVTVGGIVFNTNGYTLTGSTLTLGDLAPAITVNSGTATIESVLAGTAGLIKDGGGTLFLNGSNTFSGGITLSGGALQVANDAALGALGNNITTTANAVFTISSGSTDRTVNIGAGTTLSLRGSGTGSALYTGDGNLSVVSGVTLNNDASTYAGTTRFNGTHGGSANIFFTSVRNLGEASSLGAPTTINDGTITFAGGSQYTDRITYTGTGDSSNRNWVLSGGTTRRLINQGSGTLSLTGDIAIAGPASFESGSAGFDLLGVISGTPTLVAFSASAAGDITLGAANTFSGPVAIGGGVVSVSQLADAGVASSLGTGAEISLSNAAVVRYTGAGDSTDRAWGSVGATAFHNDGTGALTLSGDLSFNGGASDSLTFGGNYAGSNAFSGIISGTGDILSNGSSTWELSGVNTRTGTITIDGGTLRAGDAAAFGTLTGITVNGGTLDLNDYNLTTPSFAGTGGSLALGAANLTVDLGSDVNNAYDGSITGTGGLIKLGAGTLTLGGASSYTGATTVGGGTLNLDFSAAGAPLGDLLANVSTLNMSGGTLNTIGADGSANSQTFAGLNIASGSNVVAATSGAGGSMTINFGAINRSGGLMDFHLPDAGSLTTSNADMTLGWATVNGSDYAKIEGGQVLAFEEDDYTDQDDASLWLDNDYVSDNDGDLDGYFGTVTGSVQLGGLRYMQATDTTVTINPGETLGSDGTIIVAPSVLNFDQTITGGMLTGAAGGGVLGIQQNSEGIFTIASQIVDNAGSLGFTKSGPGQVALTNAGNAYTGVTTISEGTLSVANIGNGGMLSAIGASSADAANLVLQRGTLQYTGGSASSDRGFTLIRVGEFDSGTIEVTQAAADLEFSGLVTSPDGAGITKAGAGTLTLSNAANNYTGVTQISGGTLAVSTLADGGMLSSIGASASDASSLVLSGGGVLEYTSAVSASSDRGFTLSTGGGGINIADAGAVLTLSGTAVDEGGLTKDGAGTLVLSGTNTYSGGTTVDGGILRAGSTQAFGDVDARLTVNAGGTVDLAGFDNRTGALSGAGNINLGSATLSTGVLNGEFSGTISGPGGLTKHASRVQTMVGCNNVYTGVTTINYGTLSVSCLENGGLASGIGASSGDSASLVFTGGRLRYTAPGVDTSIDRGFTLQSGRGYIDVEDGATTLEFTGEVVGNGILRKEGAGTLVLSGNNTNSNTTEIVGGRLIAGSSGAFGGWHMSLFNNAGVVLDLDGFDTTVRSLIGGGATGGDIDLGSATLTIDHGSGQTFAGAISGTGSLIMNGPSIQAMSGCNSSYAGTTTINSGVLQVACLQDGGANSSIGAASGAAGNLTIDGGELSYVGSGDNTDREFTLGTSGGSLDASGSGAIDFTSTAAITLVGTDTARTLTFTGTSSDNNTFAGLIEDNGAGATTLTKTDTGTWILTNPNSTYTGITTISGGVLGVDKLSDGGVASSIGASSSDAANLVIGNGSTLRYTGSGDTTDRLFTLSSGVTFIESSGSGAIVFTDTGPVTLEFPNQARTIALGGTNTGNNTLAGSIGNAGSGTTTFAKNDSGTWVLTGDHSYTGSTNINAGTLLIGGGGTTGSITSSLLNNFGTLGFDRADTLTYGGTIVGTGDVNQVGAGTTILTGDNSYSGATTVSAGALWIHGDQSAATGLTTVQAGATLGGLGTIGGNVAVVGGTLAPGASPGTLTIAGDLILDAASVLDFEFGQSGIVGGPLNDLIEVGGDLTLDGAINVEVSAGGSFDAGIYRVINYAGGLTDNGLDIGTVPPGSEVFVQTTFANQVNLVNTAGLTLNFWDGVAGPKFDDQINGGDGIWQDSSGNDNWAEVNGAINAGYTDGAFAIFSAAPGTVTVDAGGVSAAGMQFASDGYVVTGSTVDLVAPQSTVRVGDGTLAGAGFEATIASTLTGATELVKTDLGTLILTGANSYSGGTRFEAGTLQVSSDAQLGNAAGGLTFDGGTLQTTTTFTSAREVTLEGAGTFLTDTGTTLTLGGGISGAGSLTKDGTGTLLLSNDGTYLGGTTIAAGTLAVGAGGTVGSLAGDVINNGTLAFDRSDALTFGGLVSGSGDLVKAGTNTLTLTANNTYTGATTIAGGTLQLGDGGAGGGIAGDVVNDGTLAFNRADDHAYGGDVSGSGALSQAGSGTTILNGNSTYSGATTVSAGQLRLESGGTIMGTSGTNLTGADVLGTVSGAGSVLETGTLFIAGAGGATATLRIEDGGVVRTTTNTVISVSGAGSLLPGALFVSGAGSLLDAAGSLRVGTSNGAVAGTVDITGGGAIESTDSFIGSLGGGTGTKSVTISGPGSRWTASNQLFLFSGSLSILDGGAMSAGSGNMAGFAGNSLATLLVSGPGSSLSLAGDYSLAGGNGTGRVTLAEGGLMSVDGQLMFTTAAGATGVLNIGGAVGDAAAGAGRLDAATLAFGTGTGRINFNHTDTAYDFSSAASGNGALNQLAGVTVLSGDSSAFTGTTTVSGGTLRVNGMLGDATSTVDVVTGGILGGTGTIGGDVVIADGVLAPGESPGTLTIAGDLMLDGTSLLDFEFGAADVPGGPLNDLVEVAGDLTLDGSLGVTVSAGGSFDAGLYRIFNYVGAFTDNGLEIGTIPAGSDVFVQTSVAGQVNLLNTAGLTLNIWDGPLAPRNDGAIQGGDGTWRLDGGANDWTGVDGALNADYAQDSFAIFMGTPGTVTVDDLGGDVAVSGMQFATDGYLVSGDALTLNGGSATIRVGDGTLAGAAMTAAIDSELTGAAQLVKDDAGTLVLAADNSYTGGTVVRGGTLQVSSDGYLGDAAGTLSVAGGNLQTTATFASARDVVLDGAGSFLTDGGTTLSLSGAVSGAGSLSKDGAGTLVLSSDTAHSGGTTIAGGTLQIGAGGTSGNLAGDVVNDGLLSFNRSNALTFDGTISGTGELEHAGNGTTVLTADNRYAGVTNVAAGTLLIDGDQSAASGTTGVASGATIGGAGTIGGDLDVASGGTLAPGSLGVGTLSINGNLSLAGGSLLAYDFGEPNTVGGPLNDLLEVGADLTLDGTIDVSLSPGGSFDVGLYRIASYAGALTDNGLVAGSMPAGSDVEVQTAVAGQVNLVNTAGLVLGYWDGEAGPKADAAVNGGDGQWQSGGNDNWTDLNGTVNASYANDTFAIFSAAAGNVTVDASLGTVTTAGMQFASDGYVVLGDSLALTGAQAVIRVGDGTVAGAGMTANVGSALTGSAELLKTDLGTLVLSGANSYSGGTTVETGTLLINGDQSGATGLVNVLADATLGGTGTIGGDVTIADGATLSPGSSPGPGTLTIAGNLSLGSGSVLDFELGAADVIGGALNDLVDVGGNLALDGTLNVTVPTGGAFDAGVYRLFNYAGALTDGGLELGSMPAGSSAFVQTAVANQVSLVNADGLGLNFWDGAAGIVADSSIQGGDGIWHLAGDDWTTATGSVNGPFLNDAFAVFMGAPGTVTIDNSNGTVSASGLQFAVDGYVLAGDELLLTGGPALIRVGDGTDAGANITATMRTVLAGGSMLEKSDLGTLVLAADNTYSGGTRVREGRLQLGAGGTTGSIQGNVENEGVLAFDRSDVFTFGGTITGNGALEQIGAGTAVLTGTHAYTGGTTISAGTLQIDGSLIGDTTVAGGATLSGSGTLGNVTALAGGFVSPGNAAAAFGTLRLTGDFTGSGTVVINTMLGDESSATSRLAIEGSTSGAHAAVQVNSAGGDGAQTSGDGISIITVDGDSPADSFQLAGPVQAGAYEYLLYQGGQADANDWFLRSELIDGTGGDPTPAPAWRPGVAGYALGPQASLEYGFTALGNLRSRVGAQGRVLEADAGPPADAWMRAYTHDLDISGERFAAGDMRMTTIQFGTDILRVDTGNGSAHFGVMASVGESSAMFFDPERANAGLNPLAGELEMDVAGGGLYWTRYGSGGAYLDVSAQVLNYQNRYRDQYYAVGRQDGWSGTVAAEVGVPLALGASQWHVEPQLQVGWQRLELDGFADEVSTVSEVSEDGLRGRAALQLFRAPQDWLGMSAASPYLAVGVQKDFHDLDGVSVGATAFRESVPDTTADLSLGFTGSIREGVELHFDLRYQEATEGERDGLRGNVGFRVRF